MSASNPFAQPSPMVLPQAASSGSLSGLNALSELESSLDGPPEQAAAAKALALGRIRALSTRARQAMRVGSTPEVFQRLESTAKACAAAEEVLDMIALPGDHGAITKTG